MSLCGIQLAYVLVLMVQDGFTHMTNALAGMTGRLGSASFSPCSLKASSALHVVFPVGQWTTYIVALGLVGIVFPEMGSGNSQYLKA